MILHRRGVRAAVIVVALVGLAMLVLMPPAPATTSPLAGEGPTARGAYHIHSDRSDGSGTMDEIAQAAQRAGLQFIIVTDHGDGTRPPDRPQYRHGVLVIDAVELNTADGHLVALGLPATPYPFAGEAAEVIEDVRRLGGFGMAAHPDSPRPALRWTAWDVAMDGLEWINADSIWRDESSAALARAILGYGLRAPGALALVLDRPDNLMARWDAMGVTRSVPALAAADAHARLGLRRSVDPDPDTDVATLHVALPGYEVTFRTFSNHVVLEQPLTGDADADAAAVLAAITGGHVFTVIDALATPGGLMFTAKDGERTIAMGEAAPAGAEVTLQARINGPAGTRLVLLRNGAALQETTESALTMPAVRDAGVYRVEAYTPGAPGTPPVPWIVSNPIYLGLPRVPSAVATIATPVSRIPARSEEAGVEKGSADVSELVDAQLPDARERRMAGEPPIGWRFALSPGMATGQFAAVRVPAVGGLAGSERVRFLVTAATPVRAWVQVRGGPGAQRWGRTFYADGTTRMIDLPFKNFRPIGTTTSATPPLEQIDALLFVVDTMNSRPGASGVMTISEIAFVR